MVIAAMLVACWVPKERKQLIVPFYQLLLLQLSLRSTQRFSNFFPKALHDKYPKALSELLMKNHQVYVMKIL